MQVRPTTCGPHRPVAAVKRLNSTDCTPDVRPRKSPPRIFRVCAQWDDGVQFGEHVNQLEDNLASNYLFGNPRLSLRGSEVPRHSIPEQDALG